MIAAIEASGMTPYKIGVCVGVQAHQVRRIKAGSEPKHHIGVRILELHATICASNGVSLGVSQKRQQYKGV